MNDHLFCLRLLFLRELEYIGMTTADHLVQITVPSFGIIIHPDVCIMDIPHDLGKLPLKPSFIKTGEKFLNEWHLKIRSLPYQALPHWTIAPLGIALMAHCPISITSTWSAQWALPQRDDTICKNEVENEAVNIFKSLTNVKSSDKHSAFGIGISFFRIITFHTNAATGL